MRDKEIEFLQNLKTRTKILTGSAILLAFILLIGGVSFFNINSIVATNEQVNHTHIVLSEAESIIGSAVDMETGMRGYLLAGKTDFLTPYNNGEIATYQKINELKKTVSDNPKQVKRLEQIETILKVWQQEVTEPTIALRTEIGNSQTMNDLSHLVGEAKGKVYFDNFRGQIIKFIDREQVLLTSRSSKITQRNALASIKWVTHTYDVIATANNILASAVDMETGMRGYLLAGKEDFLAPYTAG
ncbi:MAG: CHASE3 domain-containing protein [Psychrobium sp.]|nr:CHASE3 domain-containing protein [Psychrobium sp.]